MIVLEDILSQQIVQKLGWTLLHFVWQAAVVVLILAFLLWLLRKSTANLRYTISCSALALVVLLPVITIRLVPASTSTSMAGRGLTSSHPALPAQQSTITEVSASQQPAQPQDVAHVPAVSWNEHSVELLEPALPYIVSGWLIGVFVLSIWHLGGWAQLQRLRKKMVKQVNASLYSTLSRLAERLRVNRTIQLAESALVQVPTVVGWLRPVILLPATALTGLSPRQLEAMLAHELAHIKRYDYLVNILQTVVEILGFYHPAVWWVSHRIRTERENCCDDLAVSVCGDKVSYAKALTSMEEIRQVQLAVAATGGNLLTRIRRIVGKEPAGSRHGWLPSVIAILLIMALMIPTTLALTPPAQEKAAQPQQERILHFPKDRSMGQIYVLDGQIQSLDDFYYSFRETDWQYFAQAQGDVTIPAGKKVGLTIDNQDAWRDLSPLSNLKADDLYKLSIHGSYFGGPKPSNSCTKHLKHLTGLRILDLDKINISDMSFIENFVSLEYLTPPDRINDAGIAKVTKLPNLKGLYLRDNRVTNEGLSNLVESASLEELALGGERIGNAGLVHLAKLPNLRYLLLQGKNFTDSGIAHLKNVPSLRILNVSRLKQLTDAALPYVAEIPNLEAVSFYWSQNITDEGVVHLKKMRSLKKLNIGQSKVTDIGVAHLAQIKTLEYLDLPSEGITNADLQHLSNLTNLKELDVTRYHYVAPKLGKDYYTDKGLAALANCTRLEDLSIGSIGITDAGLDHIVKLNNLKNLHLLGCDNVTDKGLAKLSRLKSLTKLVIWHSNLTISGLAQLNSRSNLTELDVTDVRRQGAVLDLSGLNNLEELTLMFPRESDDAFIDADLKCLAGLKKLKHLEVGPRTRKFSDLGLSYLAGLTEMGLLDVGGSGVTNEGIKYLTNMKKLYHLTITGGWDMNKRAFISGGNITEEGLRYLGQIKSLMYLNIAADKDFSPAAVRRLRRELPRLKFLKINGRDILPPGNNSPAYGGAMMGG